jgi:hypothetical protein
VRKYIQRQCNMKYPRHTLVAMVTLVILAMVTAARAQTVVGTITQVQGAANIQRGAQNVVAAANVPVELHDKIVTQAGASVTVAMVDNSSLTLGEHTTLAFDESVIVNGTGAPSKVGLLGGKVHSLITGAMRGQSTTFEIHTPNAIGAVRGTEFDTEYTDSPHDNDKGKYKDCRQFTYVDVQDGTVNVSNPQNPGAGSKDVHSGHHTVVACGDIFFGDEDAGLLGILGYIGGIGIVTGGVVGGLAAGGVFDGNHHHSPSE